ncbi:uncharacterized protein LOC132699002 [Cylas formicarius]|uniref:uncharacterized protein LOC132699002 n=1 Tax=Cylas formicarius TaxID=197179 RepID=UPI0029589CFF|nr:uncharacterized protein LOC132699002 [Cylas formicarius]XP_060521369.1 uncharacterized protein LOC132699002 [Cylas formicarius]
MESSTLYLVSPANTTFASRDADHIFQGSTAQSIIFNQSHKSVKDLVFNGTGYYIDDEGESMFSDIQTLILACLATLAPLIVLLFTVFGIRILWMKYKKRKKHAQYDGMLRREETSESVSRPLHTHLMSDKGSDDTHLAISTEEVLVCEDTQTSGHRNANGSIITMTLKNNHLIVETEERNDIEEDSRETTMRYSPSARDGVFVVEVQQGSRRSPGSGGPTEAERSGSTSDQCALIHNPPERYSDDETLEECDDSEYYVETVSPERSIDPKTGLSQSNTSLGSLRQTYCYGNQQCYDHGSYGYGVYVGYANEEPVKSVVVTAATTKPKITSAIYKNKSASVDVASLRLNGFNDKKNSSLDHVMESYGLEGFGSCVCSVKIVEGDEGRNS